MDMNVFEKKSSTCDFFLFSPFIQGYKAVDYTISTIAKGLFSCLKTIFCCFPHGKDKGLGFQASPINSKDAVDTVAKKVLHGQHAGFERFWNNASVDDKMRFVRKIDEAPEKVRKQANKIAKFVFTPQEKHLIAHHHEALEGIEDWQKTNLYNWYTSPEEYESAKKMCKDKEVAEWPTNRFFYHATDLESAKEILRTKELKYYKVAESEGMSGAFVSTMPEKSYGKCVLIFKSTIQGLYHNETGSQQLDYDTDNKYGYWIGFNRDVKIDANSFAGIGFIDGEPDHKAQYEALKEAYESDLELFEDLPPTDAVLNFWPSDARQKETKDVGTVTREYFETLS